MSDFHMSADIGEIGCHSDNMDADPKAVAQFYRDFAHMLDPDPNR